MNEIDYTKELFGNFDANIKIIENTFNVNIVSRKGEIVIIGSPKEAEITEKLIYRLIQILESGETLDSQKINYSIKLLQEGQEDKIQGLLEDVICISSKGKQIKPKTLGQKKYTESIKNNDVVFGIGPAGTGKTYLAMAMAVSSFKNKEVSRIILTRPAVEAGESLGFLPGDLQEKVDPYLRPLYDALYDILGGETFLKYKERGMIEVAPLAYMRGRTLNDSFIILDEAQNTTKEQMKMFLTRLGVGSKAIVTGDITQIDLPKGKESGLKQAIKILSDVEGIGFVFFNENDVVRHSLVQRIIKAYDMYEKNKEVVDKKNKHRKR
ncbi:phosphate starvation-inducible protein PhoH [Crassaminicella thermophila]|uniref:PhoH-like protein n=1 Tax=Crassaminicella thermophila TaxID=2599308 RepID=A0A5C0SHG0_CRATE|nr:PhoH family protein [Crassaminicella thermophila]QEK13630.1 phosphate starvation-inducible protein PhoH [Crassaminicella thermophila]